MEKNARVWIVIIRQGEHAAGVRELADNDDLPRRIAEAEGAHGTFAGRFASRAEAEQAASEYSRCSAPQEGRYCFTHNPRP